MQHLLSQKIQSKPNPLTGTTTANETATGISVAEFLRQANTELIRSLGQDLWIEGLAHGYSPYQKIGFLVLADKNDPSQRLTILLPTLVAEKLKAGLEDNTPVLIKLKPTVDKKSGSIRPIASKLVVVEQARTPKLDVLARLTNEGLLKTNPSLKFPELPIRVGLVAPSPSKGLADVISVMAKSKLPFQVSLWPCAFQGPDAAGAISKGIRRLGSTQLDVVAVCRGGGARMDLSVLDDYQVCAAIAQCPHPVITGLGHEGDESLADLVAYRSTPTPSTAAQAIIDQCLQFRDTIDKLTLRFESAASSAIAKERDQVIESKRRFNAMTNSKVQVFRLSLPKLTFPHALSQEESLINMMTLSLPRLARNQVETVSHSLEQFKCLSTNYADHFHGYKRRVDKLARGLTRASPLAIIHVGTPDQLTSALVTAALQALNSFDFKPYIHELQQFTDNSFELIKASQRLGPWALLPMGLSFVSSGEGPILNTSFLAPGHEIVLHLPGGKAFCTVNQIEPIGDLNAKN
jgi:exodeoxyribonuclease VII large subunit